jgi:hypothetical protein
VKAAVSKAHKLGRIDVTRPPELAATLAGTEDRYPMRGLQTSVQG